MDASAAWRGWMSSCDYPSSSGGGEEVKGEGEKGAVPGALHPSPRTLPPVPLNTSPFSPCVLCSPDNGLPASSGCEMKVKEKLMLQPAGGSEFHPNQGAGTQPELVLIFLEREMWVLLSEDSSVTAAEALSSMK